MERMVALIVVIVVVVVIAVMIGECPDISYFYLMNLLNIVVYIRNITGRNKRWYCWHL